MFGRTYQSWRNIKSSRRGGWAGPRAGLFRRAAGPPDDLNWITCHLLASTTQLDRPAVGDAGRADGLPHVQDRGPGPDALAHRRRGLAGCGTDICWRVWDLRGGMAAAITGAAADSGRRLGRSSAEDHTEALHAAAVDGEIAGHTRMQSSPQLEFQGRVADMFSIAMYFVGCDWLLAGVSRFAGVSDAGFVGARVLRGPRRAPEPSRAVHRPARRYRDGRQGRGDNVRGRAAEAPGRPAENTEAVQHDRIGQRDAQHDRVRARAQPCGGVRDVLLRLGGPLLRL